MAQKMSDLSETADPKGKLADNIMHFARVLRSSGVCIGPSATVDAMLAVQAAGIGAREDFYWTLHCVMIKRREDHAVFEEAFRLFWRSRDLVEKMLQMFSPLANPTASPEKPKAAQSRVSDALFRGREQKQNVERPEVEVDAMFTASEKEILRKKDFGHMNADEIAAARTEMAKMRFPFEKRKTARFERDQRSKLIDMRRTMGGNLRFGGDLVLPVFKKPQRKFPPIVVLADISGSMAQYSRVFLHFMHVLMEQDHRVHAFLFGTRLTNVTRQLKQRDPDEALDGCSQAVEDWSGGTRIHAALRIFNKDWSRRVVGSGAVVLLITDGLERGLEEHGTDELSLQMDRLHRSCKRLIWLNPLLRFDGFEARAQGIRAMLPHVDQFLPVHNVEAVADLCHALGASKVGKGGNKSNPQAWMRDLRRIETTGEVEG